ncbi:MAG: DMT family transporter [Steroidobacteraceae bacterium]
MAPPAPLCYTAAMPIAVFGIVLFAAALHASWNAIVKGAGDKLLMSMLVAASGSILAAIALPFLRQPNPASWPYLPASVTLQITYFLLLARTYQAADMGQAYPMMRGSAPLLVALVSAVGFGEPLSAGMCAGIGMICLGILSMAAGVRRTDAKGVLLALLNALVIAGYTLIDGRGVRLSGAPAAYVFWDFLLTGLPLAAWAIHLRRGSLGSYLRGNWPLVSIGGAGSLVSYGLALWAMTVAPVAVVAALRETSILFGIVIARLLLRERTGLLRVTAACIIALGALTLRLA